MTRILPALISVSTRSPPPPEVPAHCPPGLAKRNPPCVPPGHVKSWRTRGHYLGPWVPVDCWRHDLPRPVRGETWLRLGPDVVVRVNDDTRAIVDVVRLAGVVLSN